MGEEPEEEFIRFYMRHWRKLVAALAWSVPTGEDPEDVAQEAFVRAYANWRRVSAHQRPDAWLFLTAFRIAGRLRQRHRAREQPVTYSDPGDSADTAIDRSRLKTMLDSLRPRQRAALVLRYYYGLSTRETAELLGCKEGTVKSLLSRSRTALSRPEAGLEVD